MNIKFFVRVSMGVTAFAIWSAMAYYDPALRPDYLKLLVLVCTSLATLVLSDRGDKDE